MEKIRSMDRVLDIVEDHALMEHYLTALLYAIREKGPLPVVPAFNDGAIGDMLSFIAENIKSE